MKRLAILAAALAFAAAACGSDDNPAGSTALPTKVVFTAQISTANEVPPITNAEAGGSGNMTMTFNLTRDSAGAITAATVDFSGNFSGFPAGTVLTAGHIHTGASGANGGVVIGTGIGQGEVTMPNGSGSLVHSSAAVSPIDLVNQIINNPAGFYFNIHTALNPNGVARGQLVKQP